MKSVAVAAWSRVLLAAFLVLWSVAASRAQSLRYRGFLEARGVVFPQDTLNDSRKIVVDALGRGEIFAKPWPWLQLAAGADLRADSHDQVDEDWSPDLTDRGTLRPRTSIRRLTATFSRGPLTVDAGKQFIRWGKADIVTPTDRFAPRDFLNVIDNEFLPVRGVRSVLELGPNTLDAVWVPYFTPSRLPLFNQRWAPGQGRLVPQTRFPERSQIGVRWGHMGGGYEYSVSFFDGLNHLPNLEPAVPVSVVLTVAPFATAIAESIEIPISKHYPSLRMYGGDAAVPTRWFTVIGEIGLFTSPTPRTDDYVLYVLQLERQTGEWVFVGGYAGEAVTNRRSNLRFAPDRGTSRSIVGRASYTIDTSRSVAIESVVRQNGAGLYVKGEFSQARGQHWRTTVDGVLIRGEPDDFIGQFRLNSHVALRVRYSF